MSEGESMSVSFKELRIRKVLDIYGNSLFRLACSMVNNEADAQEIVQDTLIQLLRYDPTFENTDKEKAWLMKTCVNLARNKLRSNKAHETEEFDERFFVEEKENYQFIWDAVQMLAPEEREVIYLFYQEGYTTKEMSEILEQNESSLRSKLKRSREKLKEILKEAYDFE